MKRDIEMWTRDATSTGLALLLCQPVAAFEQNWKLMTIMTDHQRAFLFITIIRFLYLSHSFIDGF